MWCVPRWCVLGLFSLAWAAPAPGQAHRVGPGHAGPGRAIRGRTIQAIQRGPVPAPSLVTAQAAAATVAAGGASGPNQINYQPGVLLLGGFGGYGVVGPYGPYLYTPPLVVIGPGGSPPLIPPTYPGPLAPGPGGFPNVAGGQGGGGLMLPMPPRNLAEDPAPRARRANPARAKEQVEIGDRSFRAGNNKRAEERYLQASKADPSSPIPHVHLAQVDLVRGDYAGAAERLRLAVTTSADPTWLLSAPDIQAMFAEPGDFARQIARLESFLQTHPGDRDAWFVLGAESYLAGRSRQALDVFRRLGDRKPDEALSAFLDASTPRDPANQGN